MCDCLLLYHFELGLFKGRFVRDNVVFVMEGMEQKELIPLRATAHQSTRLWRRSRRNQVIEAGRKVHHQMERVFIQRLHMKEVKRDRIHCILGALNLEKPQVSVHPHEKQVLLLSENCFVFDFGFKF